MNGLNTDKAAKQIVQVKKTYQMSGKMCIYLITLISLCVGISNSQKIGLLKFFFQMLKILKLKENKGQKFKSCI